MTDASVSPAGSSPPAVARAGAPAPAPASSGGSDTGKNQSPPTTNPIGPSFSLGELSAYLRQGDLALAIGIIAILVILIMPMPAVMLDVFLAISIIFSVLILMTALFIHSPLEFSAFPTVLLIATMLRLALNLASTRLILSDGHNGTDAAGQVIQAFGSFVMQGNFVIGIIVFAILVTVNFVVITKGSGRIAEVGARFTLDAMPGKQMAIDADLSAGLINEDEARTRRKNLEEEASFFGSMDGASKFVRGDAIAGLIITFINVIAGMIIGVGQQSMSFNDAAMAYTLLTVGDGLVSQIPALIVSTAAGLLVSKAGVSGAADKALVSQFTNYPKAFGMSSFVMVVMAFLPGMPTLTFLVLGAGSGALAYYADREQKARAKEEAQMAAQAAQMEAAAPKEEPISQTLRMDDLRLELGYSLINMVNGGANSEGERLTDQIKAVRRQMAIEMGFVMPSVRILDNVQVPGNDYVIKIKEVEAGRGTIYPSEFMVMDPGGGKIDLPGKQTMEPTFGLPATWVDGALREDAAIKGYTVVDAPTVVSTHLTEVLKSNLSELLSYAAVQKLLDELPQEHEKLVADIVPSRITIIGLQRVLQLLLAERVSIRDLPTILEGVADASGFTSSAQQIGEHVRSRLARQMCAAHQAPGGYLPVLSISPKWEAAFAESLVGEGEEKNLAMPPSQLQEFVVAVRDGFDNAARAGEMPVLLTSPGIRPYVRSIVERFRPHTTIMSHAEVHPSARLKTLSQV